MELHFEKIQELRIDDRDENINPDLVGAYISRRLTSDQRQEFTRYLATDDDARELMMMSFRALKASDGGRARNSSDQRDRD